jgi:gamma-glutamyl:cysteine ligase YbdK (ATP-grasp superfamily)
MKNLQEFMNQFEFNPKKNLFIGTERECHLLNQNGEIIPIAQKVLKGLSPHNGEFTFELSACQLEWRIGPCKDILFLEQELKKKEAVLQCAEKRMHFKRSFSEVAPDDMPLDVYPDPKGRYGRITKHMPKKVLLAACQVIATHIHIGMPNHKIALRTYNRAIKHYDELCKLGDHSNGKRLSIYGIMAPHYQPPPYENWYAFYKKAEKENFINDPRSCWTLIRISRHGTIEFRMFGATEDIDEILEWAALCKNICRESQ